MFSRLKNYFWIALGVGAFFFLLSYHFIFVTPTSFYLLKKHELTLKYTFFNLGQTTPEVALRIDTLRDDGLGELMVEKGIITEEKLSTILRKLEYQQ